MFSSNTSSAGGATDPQFNYVTMLLPGNGTNGAQNNTFVDSSTNNFTITRNGNTTQGTFTPYGSLWSVNLGSSSTDWVATPSSASFAFGTGDFTMEAFVYATASQTDNWIIGLYNNCWLRVGSGGVLEFYNAVASSSVAAGSAMPTNQWVHVAAVRSGTTLTIYQNGTSVASGTVSTNFSTSVACVVGNQGGGFDRRWNGYISNVRVVKGTAVYTSAFTPSTTNLTAITNTVLLTCQNNRYIDNSSNAFALTVSGSPSVQRFSPFAPTAAYSAATVGGSAYFDGSGDYLGVGSNAALALGSGSFTVEAWVYPTSTSQTDVFSGSATGAQFLGYTSNSGNGIGLGRVQIAWDMTTGALPTVGQWNHIVWVRSGTSLSIYLNGVRVGNTTNSTNYGLVGGSMFVGAQGSPVTVTPAAYFSNVRVVVGTAVYDPAQTTLTIPTAPLTAITNTSLLLNFTNGGIIDNAMMNDLETVGNAQISTSVSKFGGGSVYMDGTGDWLLGPGSPNFDFAGDFTIECWVYIAGNSNPQPNNGTRLAMLFQATNTGGSADGTLFAIIGNTSTTGTGFGFYYYANGTEHGVTATTSISQSTWHHIAVSRSGTTMRLFLNGVSQTVSTSGSPGTVNINNKNYPVYVGAGNFEPGTYGNRALNGYIDDYRITKGVARYTANFTPPAAPFPTN